MSNKEQKKFYTYMIECIDGSYYTGYTVDLHKRFEAHKSGRGAKYTRAHKPVEYAYIETFKTKSEAMKRECAIKKLSHEEKALLAKKYTEKTKFYAINVCLGIGGTKSC